MISGVISYVSEETSDLIKDALHLKAIPYIDARNQGMVAAQNRLIKVSVLHVSQNERTENETYLGILYPSQTT